MKSIEAMWRRAKLIFRHAKNTTLPRLKAKAMELKRRHGPAMNAIRHADVLIAKWPNYYSLARKAKANIKKAKRSDAVATLVRNIEYGKVLWIPVEKRAGALLFVELHAGGIELEEARLKQLGLDRHDVEALEQLVKNSF